MSDWHTHVFTSTYTADVSGVCSVMYELGGMTVLHDPSGCNSTYTTHDEPRWYDTDSLMYISGLDEMAAVFGDDSVIIHDAVQAAKDLSPRFITLCGSSIPHIISFDFRGVARLIEEETGIPVLPVKTDGLKSYVSGVGLAAREWLKRFGNFSLAKVPASVNLLGVTPIDFSRQEIVDVLTSGIEGLGLSINACFAMGDSFEDLTRVPAASVNLAVSSAGRIPARYLSGKCRAPFVEGLPYGRRMYERLGEVLAQAEAGDASAKFLEKNPAGGEILVVGEEVAARSLATAINASSAAARGGRSAYALWPDVNEGLDEENLVRRMNAAQIVICDPLFSNCLHNRTTKLIPLPHEGYSGRIYRDQIPVFTDPDWDCGGLLD